MKLWKILLATMIALLLVSAVAMADTCDHNDVEIGRVPTTTVYQVPNDNEHYRLYTVTYGCNKCNDPATYHTVDNVQVPEYCTYNIKGETVAATCVKGEYTVYRCVCGGKEERDSTLYGPKGHTWNNNKKIFDGDCKTPTKWAKVCEVCNEQEGPAWTGDNGDHVWSVSQLDPTCTADGLKYKTCTVKGCGVEDIEVIKSDKTHRWDYANTTVVAPTCEEGGYSTAKCMDCGTVSPAFNLVNALTHNKETTPGKDATCKENGFETYKTCKRCGQLFDANGLKISAIKVLYANENDHDVPNGDWQYVRTSCTATNNYKHAECIVCHKEVYVTLPATEHTYASPSKLAGKAAGYTEDGVGGVKTASNCTKEGTGYLQCSVCKNQYIDCVIPAQNHNWNNWTYGNPATCTTDMIAQRTCKNDSRHVEYDVVVPATGHNWKVMEDSTTATCDKAGVCSRICTNAGCGVVENNVVVAALGHKYEEKVTAAATCTKDGEVAKTCSVCGDKKTEKIPAAHGATKEVAGKAPACDVAGTIDVICTVCNAKVGEKTVAALAHEYEWKTTAATPSANGKSEYKCALCGDVAEVKTIKYSKVYYNNTITSYGPMTKELIGGSDWYRVTPVDLSIDGVYTYDLIASNKYVVGTVTITVNAGTLTVSYNAYGVDVKDEALLIYASKADLAAGVAVTANVGAAINAAETFGADTKVLVSLVLTGDYDAAGKGLIDDSAVAAMIANID